MDLYNVLPHEVKEKFGRHLAKEDEKLSNIEGQKHLEAMLTELKLYYRAVETALCNAPPSQPNHESHPDQGVHSTSLTKPSQQHHHLDKRQSKGQGRSSHRATAVHKSAQVPTSCLPRWTCPLSSHEDHTIQSCPEFFFLTAKERRRSPIPEMCINPATPGVNRAAPMPRRIAIGPALATCNTGTMPKLQTVTRPATLPLIHIPTATDPSTQKEPEIMDVRNDPLGAAFGVQAFTRIQTGKLILPCLALVNDKEAWTVPVPDSC
jgi:hypothetical protein